MAEDEKKTIDPATFEGVELNFKRVLCPVHGYPFMPAWPKGYAIFMVRAFQETTALEGAWADASRLAGLPDGADVPVKALEIVLDLKPACCRISQTKLVELYTECKIGTMARCSTCSKRALGTPVTASNVAYAHCCFTCIAGASATPQNVD